MHLEVGCNWGVGMAVIWQSSAGYLYMRGTAMARSWKAIHMFLPPRAVKGSKAAAK